MAILVTGLLLLSAVLLLYWMKNRLRQPWLARLAYSQGVLRLAVVAFGLVILGLTLVADRWFG